MPDDFVKAWTCVGSAGVVNLPDIGKIIFNNSIAQLGPASSVVVGPPAESAADAKLLRTQTTTAVIRYNVVAVDGVYLVHDPSAPPFVQVLRLRYRDGAGHVSAKLIQVNLEFGTELTQFQFDSGFNNPVSNDFQIGTSDPKGLELDFLDNAYYVELTLTLTEPLLTERPPAFPPAVSLIQFGLTPPF